MHVIANARAGFQPLGWGRPCTVVEEATPPHGAGLRGLAAQRACCAWHTLGTTAPWRASGHSALLA